MENNNKDLIDGLKTTECDSDKKISYEKSKNNFNKFNQKFISVNHFNKQNHFVTTQFSRKTFNKK